MNRDQLLIGKEGGKSYKRPKSGGFCRYTGTSFPTATFCEMSQYSNMPENFWTANVIRKQLEREREGWLGATYCSCVKYQIIISEKAWKNPNDRDFSPLFFANAATTTIAPPARSSNKGDDGFRVVFTRECNFVNSSLLSGRQSRERRVKARKGRKNSQNAGKKRSFSLKKGKMTAGETTNAQSSTLKSQFAKTAEKIRKVPWGKARIFRRVGTRPAKSLIFCFPEALSSSQFPVFTLYAQKICVSRYTCV